MTAGPSKPERSRSSRHQRLLRRMYRGGRPHRVTRSMNRVAALLFSLGLVFPSRAATLQVTGRRSGRPIALPVAIADHAGGR